MSEFIHLRAHSTYSIKDGLAFPAALVEKAKELDYPALALTDEAYMFAALKFFTAAKEHAIKPILGMDFFITDTSSTRYRVTTLVKSKEGYGNLMRLSTHAQTVSAQKRQRGSVPRTIFAQHSGGLLVLSGASEGDVGQALMRGDKKAANEHLRWWQDLCKDDYYLELQRLGRTGEEVMIAETLVLAKECSCPLLATNDVRFLAAEDFDAHRLRVCIGRGETMGGERRKDLYQKTQFLRAPAEMAQLFSDIPEALENTMLAARRCSFILHPQPCLPVYPLKEKEDAATMLKKQAYAGIEELLGENWTRLRDGEYQKRLDMELKVIADVGYSDYFLIVGDFVRWAKNQNIAVGPGRGSGAGSLVAYAISITALDPLVHSLLFERFLNPGRGSMPDFDIDVCMERRDEVIDYIRTTYGEEAAVHIISFGTMGARGVIRDVTRVLNKPFSLGDKIAQLIPEMPGMTLESAIKEQDGLKQLIEQDEEARNIFTQARKLEGTVRQTGSHAAGLVITSDAVANHCPLYADDDNLLTQFDKDDLESLGLVKFDVLGLRTLTVIDHTLKMIRQHEHKEIDMAKLPLNDPETFKVISSAQTYAVFQLESSGMRDVARRMKPQSFEDIAALNALFRPGPMELIDDFIKNKETIEKGEKIKYPHPKLEPILSLTYGIPIYQEQIMQMAQALAGFSLTEADVLRHAMAKKKKGVMREQEELFIRGVVQKGGKKKDAENLFALVEKFAGYGFNRSHSVGYALLAYWTAYLKTHHPQSFLAAYMTSEVNNHKKIARLVEEAQRLKIKVLPPDINEDQAEFSLTKNSKAIRYGLASIKGIGRRAARAIVAERRKEPYKGFFDLCARIEEKILTRPFLENLVRAGAFHSLEKNQALLMNNIERGILHNRKIHAAADQAVGDMFATSLKREIFIQGETPRAWGTSRSLNEEKLALGFCLRGDAFNIYKKELRRYIKADISDIRRQKEQMICGRIAHLRRLNYPQNMMSFTLYDDKTSLPIRLHPQAYANKEHLLADNMVVAVKGRLGEKTDLPLFYAKSIHGLEYLRIHHCAALCLESQEQQINKQRLDMLKEALRIFVHKVGLPFYIKVHNGKMAYRVRFLKNSQIVPSNECLEKLTEILPEAKTSLPLSSEWTD